MMRSNRARYFSESLKEANKIGIIGGGAMAEAIIRAIIRSGHYEPNSITVSDLNKARRAQLTEEYGVKTVESALEAAQKGGNIILLAVKPQNMKEVSDALDELQWNEDMILLSILAGVNMKSLKDSFPNCTNFVRSMPNTPASIEEGMSVWYSSTKDHLEKESEPWQLSIGLDDMIKATEILTIANSGNDVKKKLELKKKKNNSNTENKTIDDNKKEQMKVIFRSMGADIEASNEQYIDMATAISGSGPAYVFLLTESLIDSAVHLGFPRDMATKLVTHTIRGSASIALKQASSSSTDNMSTLRYKVSSPGGTTASAVYELEKGNFRTVITDAVWAAYRRCLELGEKNPNIGPGRNTF